MKFHHVTIFQDVIPMDHLPFILFGSPDSGKPESVSKILVNGSSGCHDCRALLQNERIVEVHFLSRRFGIDADDVKHLIDAAFQKRQARPIVNERRKDAES